MDYHGMADAAGSLVERVVALPGSGTEAFIAALDGRTPVDRLDSLDDAIEHAERIAGPRSTVLLSPGCAFFFSRYIEGGPSFRQRVRRHLGLDAE